MPMMKSRSGALDGAAQALGAQPGVGDDDHGAQPQAGVDQRGQFDARGHQQVHPVAGADAEPARPAASAFTRLASSAQDRVAGRAGWCARGPCRRRRGSRRRRARPARPAWAGTRTAPAASAAAAVSGRFRCPGRRRREPVEDRCGDVHVLGQQVAGAFETVHIGVRQPVDQVAQVAVGEHRILGAPEHQGRHVQAPDAFGDPVQGRASWGAWSRRGCPRRSCRRPARRAAPR